MNETAKNHRAAQALRLMAIRERDRANHPEDYAVPNDAPRTPPAPTGACPKCDELLAVQADVL